MKNRSIDTHADILQQGLVEAQKATIHELIYCPMCEELHENNTWCQLPGGIMAGNISTGSAQS